MCRFVRRGQTTLEYTAVIVVIIAALLAMTRYIKRGMMGKLRESTDSIGEQFAPLNFRSSVTVTSSGTTSQTSRADGEVQTTVTADMDNSRTNGEEHIETGLNQEKLW